MKHSIRRQMMGLFIGLLICMLIALLAVNIWFLEPYYIQDKEEKFVAMYTSLKEAVLDGNLQDTDTFNNLYKQAEKNNMFFLVVNLVEQRGYSNVPDTMELKQQLDEFLLNQSSGNDKILQSTDDYEISQTNRHGGQTDDLRMRGALADGYYFVIRSPLASIQESVAISNQFLICVGCIIILIGSILVLFFSRWLTDPILELAALSVKMADLDFDVKYKSGGENEIGILGENFNTMSEKLEKAISDLKSANYHLQKDIEKKEKLEKMRNDFLGNVSHELKTPIALIQGYAEGLKEGVNDDAESREFYCDVIMDEAAKMNQMVRNLLTLNQLEFGDEDVQFTRFNLTELVAGVLSSMDILAQQKEARVIFRQKDPVYVWADELKVEQVVRNYISNAFNHVSGDMVIEVKLLADDEKARVTVFNTGVPIPEEDISHIWEKFYKVDKAHTREYGGNGIGLSIVKAIMESFHQNYGVNNYDNGVEFWFELDVR